MTKQRRWQLAKQAAGMCITCGKPRSRSTRYCNDHQIAHNAYTRSRNAPFEPEAAPPMPAPLQEVPDGDQPWWKGMPPGDVVQKIAQEHGSSRWVVIRRSRHRVMVNIRFKCAEALRAMGLSLPEIGRELGGRDHTTIISLLRRGVKDYDYRRRAPGATQ